MTRTLTREEARARWLQAIAHGLDILAAMRLEEARLARAEAHDALVEGGLLADLSPEEREIEIRRRHGEGKPARRTYRWR